MQRKECHLLISHPKAILISLEVSQMRTSNVWYYLLSHKWTRTKPRFVRLQFCDHGVLRLIQKDSRIDYTCFHSILNSPFHVVVFPKISNPPFHQLFTFFFFLVTEKIVGSIRVTSLLCEIALSWISSGLFSVWKNMSKESYFVMVAWNCSHEQAFSSFCLAGEHMSF